MYTKDDRDSAKLPDRLIAAAIGGILGYWIGKLVSLILISIFGWGGWINWLFTFGFGAYGFMAPMRSRDMWGNFWIAVWDFLKGNR